ncbi:MAG: Ig-like domain-containing protein [Dysgonamonadaceae bacterium]|jgi:hypothetical protein|nr:Ig-like domain-containing protein [Dysgonamonadaceae bacterium]
MNTPSGGDYDVTPPLFIRSKPEPNSIRFNGNKIELWFDEYLNIEKPREKVIISPPQQKTPVIKAVGRKITVELRDSLIPNTTYTFDFTDGIVDNNEKNPIEGFTFAFSTGDVIDSLIVSGILLNAEDLEPMPNIMVGLHSNLEDSAFTSIPFLRTSQTNERGQFWIRNIAPGSYRIFALNEMNHDFRFNQPGEAIAFYDSIIVPSFEPAMRMDTIWKDSLTVDTVMEVQYNRFFPDDIQMFLFKEDFSPQYFFKSERPLANQFILNFNADKALPPDLHLLDCESPNNWYIMETSPDKKILTYWITDSLVYKQDTLRLEMNYCVDDSLNNLISQTDTLKLILRKKDTNKKDKDKEEKIEFLEINSSFAGSLEVYDTLKITFSEPLFDLDRNMLLIQQKIDTLWEKRNFPIIQDSLNPRIFYIDNIWPYEQEYQLKIDSATIYSIYGKWNNSINIGWKTPSEEEYGDLYVIMEGAENQGFGQLMDYSGKIVREAPLSGGELAFENLKAGKYYLRYINDLNANGKWDTGDYAKKLQPEQVYYYPTFIEIRKFSELEQHWNVKEISVEKQKPLDITKNKPAVKQPKRDEKNQKKSNGTNNQSGLGMPNMPGMPRF